MRIKSCNIIHAGLKAMGVLGFIIITLLLPSCKGNEKEKAAPPVPKVIITQIREQKIPIIMDFSGTLTSVKTVEIVPRVSGYIMERFFTEGTVVDEESPLYLIDSRPYQARLDALVAKLRVDEASLKFWEKEIVRYKRLVAKGAASQEKFEGVTTNHEKSKAAIKKDQADIENARLDLSFTKIKAPFKGRVMQTKFHKGALVHQQRDVLTAIIQMDPIYVIFNISRKQAFDLQKQKRGEKLFGIEEMVAQILLPDGTTYQQKGKINFVDFLINPATDSITVRTVFPNPPIADSAGDYDLIPGQYAPLMLTVGNNPAAILIPKPALIQGEMGSKVLVVGEDNKVESRTIVLGGVYDKKLIIVDGLKPGERIIVAGVQKVKEGMIVEPQESSSKSSD